MQCQQGNLQLRPAWQHNIAVVCAIVGLQSVAKKKTTTTTFLFFTHCFTWLYDKLPKIEHPDILDN